MGRFSGMACAAVAVVAMSSTPVLAQDWSSLQGMRSSAASDNLRSRGYRPSGHSGGFDLWSDGHTCVGVRSRSGSVSEARGFHQRDCGATSDSGSDAGAAVAGLLIAGLIGAAVASHDDHHHRDNQHGSDARNEAEYERGYNDGLHDGAFSDYDRNPAYSEGWDAGQRERQNRLSASRYSYHSRGSANEARAACASAADDWWRLRPGSSSAFSARAYSNSAYEVQVAAGYQQATCTYENGRVQGLR